MTPTDNLEAGAGDLVARLNREAQMYEAATFHNDDPSLIEMDAGSAALIREAAAQLAAVTAENARLREALEPFAKIAVHYIIDTTAHLYAESESGRLPMKRRWFRRARAALSQEAPK